jgi:hypothetical protein
MRAMSSTRREWANDLPVHAPVTPMLSQVGADDPVRRLLRAEVGHGFRSICFRDGDEWNWVAATSAR